MKFDKEFLQDAIYDKDATIYDRIIGHGRWSVHHERVLHKAVIAAWSERQQGLEATVASLKEALKKYGQHEVRCPRSSGWTSRGYYQAPTRAECTCGFSAALTDPASPEQEKSCEQSSSNVPLEQSRQ